jgi:transcriptional regulator with PAS, ATPase and Fis domain
VTVSGKIIQKSDLPSCFLQSEEKKPPFLPMQGKSLKGIMNAHEAMVLRWCLHEYGTTRAVAVALGINQSSVVRKMRRLKLQWLDKDGEASGKE